MRRGVAIMLVCAGLLPGAAAAQISLPPLPPTPPPPGSRPEPQPPPQPGPVSPAPGSVAQHVNVAQTGFFANDELVPPLVARWSVPGDALMLLAADGRVYAHTDSRTFALDQRDGRELWSVPGGGHGIAYDGGIVFAGSRDSFAAYAADSGRELWKRGTGGTGAFSVPVASGGVVYVANNSGEEALYAFRASDGTPLWNKKLQTGGIGSPALDDKRIFVSGWCSTSQAFDRASGNELWAYDGCSSGGAPVTPALVDGRLWAPGADVYNPDSLSQVLEAATGGPQRSFGSGDTPLFVDGLALLQTGEGLVATTPDSGAEVWRSKAKSFRGLIAIGHDVYGFRSGADNKLVLAALDSEKGEEVWATREGIRATAAGTTPTLAAAPGMLISSARSRITAYESALRPEPRGIAITTPVRDVESYARLGLTGLLGSELRGGRPKVTVEGAGWRRGRFRGFGAVTPARDGGFVEGFRTTRNARIRVSAGGAHSNVITIYAHPRVRLGRPLGTRRRARVRVTVRARGVKLSGRTFVLYYQRHGRERLTRLGVGRLRGRRRGSAAATVAFRPRGSTRDRVWYCVKGQLRLALGRPRPLTRRCGVRTLRRP